MKFELNRRNDNKDYNSDYFDSFLNNFFDKEEVFENKTEYTSNKEVEVSEIETCGDYSNHKRDTDEAVLSKDLLFTVYTNGNFRFKVKNLDGRTIIDQYGELRQSQYYEKNFNYCFDMEIIDERKGDKRKGKRIFGLITKRKKEIPIIDDIKNVDMTNYFLSNYFKKTIDENNNITYRTETPLHINNKRYEHLIVSEFRDDCLCFSAWETFDNFKSPPNFQVIGKVILTKITNGEIFNFFVEGGKIKFISPYHTYSVGEKENPTYFFDVDMRDNVNTLKENDKMAYDYDNIFRHKIGTGINMSDIYSGDTYTTGTDWENDKAWTINLGECVIDASQAKITYSKENKKEEKMKDRFSSFMPAKVKTGEVALTMTGALAVRGKDGNYVSYNKKTKQIEDHMDLVFGEGRIEEMCFLMPTDIKQLKEGDIVNSNGAYCYVEGQDTETGKLTLVNFLTSVREDAVGSENVFTKMSTVRKLVTAFDMTGGADGNPMANMLPFMLMSGKDKGGDDSMFKIMMMSQMMGGNMGGDSNSMNPMMMMMFMDKL